MMQGPSFAFMTPIIAMMKLKQFECPDFSKIVYINFEWSRVI